MKTNSTGTESKTESFPKMNDIPPADTGSDDNLDDLGYEIVKPATPPAAPPAAAPSDEPKTDDNAPTDDDKPVDKKVTGYDVDQVEAPKDDKKPVESPKDEKKDLPEEEATVKEIETAIAELGEGYNKEKIKAFATENKMTPAQVKAYVEFRKQEDAQLQEAIKIRAEEAKKQNLKELMSDPEFGGPSFSKDVFNRNLNEVEKTLEKHFPGVKKVLTDKGGMLPPYLMKDILALSKVLNPKKKFDGGDPPAPKTDDPHSFLEDMYGN